MIKLQRSGELACYLGGLLRRLRAVQRRVQVDAFAPAGDRYRVMSDVAQDVADQRCNPGTFSKAHSGTWIKIKDQAVRIPRLPARPEAPLWYVNFQGGLLR